MESYDPIEKLPKIGERVEVLCRKEMIFTGGGCYFSSIWEDDGEGDRGIISWNYIDKNKLGEKNGNIELFR